MLRPETAAEAAAGNEVMARWAELRQAVIGQPGRVALGVGLVDGHCACVPFSSKTRCLPLPSSHPRPVSPSRAFDAFFAFLSSAAARQFPAHVSLTENLENLERRWLQKREGRVADSFHSLVRPDCLVRTVSSAAELRSRLPPGLHRPGLVRPHFHHHLDHGRERRRTGSSNQPCVTRCEITHAEALVQAGFPNGINAVSSPPQCHTSPPLGTGKSRDPALRFCRPTDDFLLLVCLVQSAGCPRPPRPISRAGSRALDRAHSIQRIESFTGQAPRPSTCNQDNVLPPPSPLQVHGRGDQCQAGAFRFRFRHLVPDHGNAPAASRLISGHLRPSEPLHQANLCADASRHGPWFWRRRGFFRSLSRKHGPGFHCPAKLYVPKNARPALPRRWARLDPTALLLKTRRRHSACGAVKHTRQVKPGRQIDASTRQLPGIRSEPRRELACMHKIGTLPRTASPQPVQASWSRRTTAPAPQHLSTLSAPHDSNSTMQHSSRKTKGPLII